MVTKRRLLRALSAAVLASLAGATRAQTYPTRSIRIILPSAPGTVRGNTVRAEATLTRADGTTSKIADVVLDNSQTDSIYLGDTTVSAATAHLAVTSDDVLWSNLHPSNVGRAGVGVNAG
jgi:hypothetical protein